MGKLNPVEFCEPDMIRAGGDPVMLDWAETHSPLAYWERRFSDHGYMWTYDLPGRAFSDGHREMAYGLPIEEAVKVCRWAYSNNVAKLTVEIAEPDVMEIKRDIKANFSDQLGVIGT